MRYPDYLVHYNKNHDKKTGRFTFSSQRSMGMILSGRQAKKNNTYYNDDGTLTDAGKKKYAISKKQANALLDLEEKRPLEFYKTVNSFDVPIWFNSKNPEHSTLVDARVNKQRVSDEINKKAYELGEKASGVKTLDIFGPNAKKVDPTIIDKYMEAGIKYAQSKEATDKMRKAMKDIDAAERAYEKKVRQFVDDWLGEYGNLPVRNPLSVSVDLNTGEVSQQTLSDRVAWEIYKKQGGRPR